MSAVPPVLRLHSFTGYGGVLLFALPYCAVYAASVYLLAMNEDERQMVRGIARRVARR